MAPAPYILSPEWEHALHSWLSFLTLRGLSPATRKLRRDHIRALARLSGTDGPADLTGTALAKLCAASVWSAEHRKAVRASVCSFYQHCVVTGLVAEDISGSLPKVQAPQAQPRPATDEIWAAILAAASTRERLMARLAAEAGLRRAEVARAHYDDLIADLSGPSLIVHGKGGKQRVVALTDALATEIRGWCRGGYLFPGRIEGHISVEYVGQLISALMPPGWSMHRLRTRFATRGYAGTGNLRAVQEALGHASVATTQRYTAVAAREIRAVAEAAASREAS